MQKVAAPVVMLQNYPMATDPIRPTDDEARSLARSLMTQAKHAAVAVLDDGAPMVSRIAFGLDPVGRPITLISDLSHHTRALRLNPTCSVLIGDPGTKGDPLTYPRLTLQATVAFIDHDVPQYAEMAAHYLRDHPKAKLYIGFGDFHFARFDVTTGYLNGGFGKAFVLSPKDLGLA